MNGAAVRLSVGGSSNAPMVSGGGWRIHLGSPAGAQISHLLVPIAHGSHRQ